MPELTIEEMARRYIAKAEPCIEGQGGCHARLFAVACALVKGFDFRPDEARPILDEYNARCSPPWSEAEIHHKLTQADGVADEKPRGWLRLDVTAREQPGQRGEARSQRPVAQPPPKPEYSASALMAFSAPWRGIVDTAWLADRSPVMPWKVSTDGFLRAIYGMLEKVVFFTVQESQGQGVWPDDAPPSGGPEGVWYLAQPVDGESHPNPRSLDKVTGRPKMSRRSEESVTSWRYLVLESDKAHARAWMAALVQLPLAITAIYTSGGRSIHALVRVDAPTKQEWDNQVKQLRPALVTLGADPRAMSAVRLSRLPGCLRGEKLQKLLYLDPEPPHTPICQRKKLRDVVGTWEAFWEGMKPLSPAEIELDESGAAVLEEFREAVEWFASSPRMQELREQIAAWHRGGSETTTPSQSAAE